MAKEGASVITISAADSASHQLPAAGITVNPHGRYFSVAKFASQDQYLALSGPPGEPLGMQVERVANAPADETGWRKLVEKRFAEQRPIEMGSAAELEIADGKQSSFTCTTGESLARAHHLLISVPVPGSDDAILVDFRYGAGQSETPTPKAVVNDGEYAELLRSLSIRFE